MSDTSRVIAYRVVCPKTGKPRTDWIDGSPEDDEPIFTSSKYQLAYDHSPASFTKETAQSALEIVKDADRWKLFSKAFENNDRDFLNLVQDGVEALNLGDDANPTKLQMDKIMDDVAAMIKRGDFTEDFKHENGNYTCHCQSCGRVFTGHKRRVICKVCVQAEKGHES